MDELWKIFNNVNFWLEYAEKKNGYILTLVGLQVALIKIFDFKVDIVLLISIIMLFVCILLCIISFFPRTKITKWIYSIAQSPDSPKNDDNMMFYGHIIKYSFEEYIVKMEKYLGISIHDNNHLCDLCNQIVINAGITDEKFNIFKICFWFFLLGQAALVLHILELGNLIG